MGNKLFVFCVLAVFVLGISSFAFSAQTSADTGKVASISNPCAADLSDTFQLHVPIIDFLGNSYWADFQNIPNTFDFMLTNAGVVGDPTPYAACTHATLSDNLKLHMPAVNFADDIYWLDLAYKNGFTFSFNDAGIFDDDYAFAGDYLQYRTLENSSNNNYVAWIGLTKNGQPIQSSDVTTITLSDSQGNTVWDGTNRYFYASTYYEYDCTGATPAQSGPLFQSGILGSFADLPAGTYTVEVDTADNQKLTTQVDYPGRLVLPVIPSSTLNYSFNSNGDLVLSWQNPTSDPNWPNVTKLRIEFYDQNNTDRLHVSLPLNAENVTIPKALFDDAVELAGTSEGGLNCHIETQAYDSNGMNYARGVSNSVFIHSQGYAFAGDSYLQYRTTENNVANVYYAWITLTKDGNALQSSDFSNIQVSVKDSQGNVVNNNLTPYVGSYYWYDFTGSTPAQSGPYSESGFNGSMADLSAGTYTVEVDTPDQNLSTQITYTGQLALPVVSSSTMQSSFNSNGDLTLNWTNPTTNSNWSHVTGLEIYLDDQSGITRLYVGLNPNQQTATIPKALLDEAAQLAPGGVSSWTWEIQTRAYDSNNMNYARGNSNTVQIPFTENFESANRLDIDYEFSSGQNFTDINGFYSDKKYVGYLGYMYYFFSSTPVSSTLPWDTATLQSPVALNGGNDAMQCWFSNDSQSVTVNFFCGGSVTSPAQPPEGDYQVHVGAKTYIFSGVHSRLVTSDLDNVFLPEIRLTMDASGKISRIDWRWWEKQSGSWVTPSSSDLSNQIGNAGYEIGQADWCGKRVAGNLPLTPTGSLTAASQSFTPAAIRISYNDKQGYQYGIEWR